MDKLKNISVWITTIPLALLLIGIILCSTVENLHSTLLDYGEQHWTGYSELRQPAVKPDCDVTTPPAINQKNEEDALLDDLFGDEDQSVSAEAQAAAQAVCNEKLQKYEALLQRQNDHALQIFVSFESAVGNIATNSVAFGKHFLVLIFIFCGLATTLQRQHLGLRTPTSKSGDRASQAAQLIGNLIVLFSFLAYYKQDLSSGVDNVSNLPLFWMTAFGLMALANLLLLFKPLSDKPATSLATVNVDNNANVDNNVNDIKNKIVDNNVNDIKNKIVDSNVNDIKNKIVDNNVNDIKNKIVDNNVNDIKNKIVDNNVNDIKNKIVDNNVNDIKNEIVDSNVNDIKNKIVDSKAKPQKPSISEILLGIPLYAYMALICGFYFAFIEQHFAGVGIYLNQMTEHADLYTNVALYVFCGMLLKYTDIADRFLAILRPLKMSPELLVFVIVLLSAIPTAYSGASGIFVIAAGAIIYKELKSSGSRDGLALAGTAMSGSMGIVLSPCLLVVIIAALNKDVTTTELFSAGLSVFLVNIFILALVLLITKRKPISIENPIIALPKAGKACLGVIPYIIIGALVLLFFNFGLGAAFDEYSAPAILPFVLLVLLIYDRIHAKRQYNKLPQNERPELPPDGILKSLFKSVNATSIHSGGLLSLMTLSICVGGIIDRANLTNILPHHFAHPMLAMAMLFIILVFIGMIMDPYGAVILVSATLTQIASANGIAPVHFWVTVLCAFELGYLTPPVALNQLLTRQVVGESAYDYERKPRPGNFWYRHERLLLPVTVKGIVLILVAFIPLLVNVMHWVLK